MQTETLSLTFTFEEANILLAGLAELPAKVSMSIIQKVQDQAKQQMEPAVVSEEPSEE